MLRRVRYLKDPKVFAGKALKRLRVMTGRPESWLELHQSNLEVTGNLTYADRKVLLEYLPCLQGAKDIVFYDIGANKGQHSLPIAKLSSVTKVVAFEPLSDIYHQLQEKASRNSKITSFNLALGDRNGTIAFNQNPYSASSSALPMKDLHAYELPWTAQSVQQIEVPVRRLDDVHAEFSLPDPFIVKLDVQGFEDRVIEGGRDTISTATWILTELSLHDVYDGGPLFDDMYQLLRSLDFRLWGITSDIVGMSNLQLQVNALFVRNGRDSLDQAAGSPQ